MTDTQPTAAGPRVQRREVWVDLPSEYAGFRARIWVNAPGHLYSALLSGPSTSGENEDTKETKAQDAASKIVLEHNGWLDFDGEPYPPASDPNFWEAIPAELTAVLLIVVRLEMAKLPNSMVPKKRR